MNAAMGTKEFYEIVAMFEKAVKTMPFVYRLERELSPKADRFYTDGETNTAFFAFQSGVSFGVVAFA